MHGYIIWAGASMSGSGSGIPGLLFFFLDRTIKLKLGEDPTAPPLLCPPLPSSPPPGH